MSDTSILGLVFSALWGLVVALAGVIWATLREQNRGQATRLDRLEAQNTEQEKSIVGLTQRMIAREDAHAQHREDTVARLERMETNTGTRFDKLEAKFDQLIRAMSSKTPYPSAYRGGGGSEGDMPPVKR